MTTEVLQTMQELMHTDLVAASGGWGTRVQGS